MYHIPLTDTITYTHRNNTYISMVYYSLSFQFEIFSININTQIPLFCWSLMILTFGALYFSFIRDRQLLIIIIPFLFFSFCCISWNIYFLNSSESNLKAFSLNVVSVEIDKSMQLSIYNRNKYIHSKQIFALPNVSLSKKISAT